jgi:hypothetical protein
MMIDSSRRGAAAVLLAVAMLTGCVTAYGPRGFTGGYTETKMDEGLYRVTFNGNGHTTRNMVWRYWIYRCAELTTQMGYSHFILLRPDDPIPKPVASADLNGPMAAALTGGADAALDRATPTATHSAPVYIYTPSYSAPITTYSTNAVVKMLRNPAAYPGRPMLRADVVMKMIGPYVQSKGQAAISSDVDILKAAIVLGPGVPPQLQRNGPVTMDDLKNLLPAP